MPANTLPRSLTAGSLPLCQPAWQAAMECGVHWSTLEPTCNTPFELSQVVSRARSIYPSYRSCGV